MIEIDLKCVGSHEPVRVLVNGQFAADVVVGKPDTIKPLLAVVASGRVAYSDARGGYVLTNEERESRRAATGRGSK